MRWTLILPAMLAAATLGSSACLTCPLVYRCAGALLLSPSDGSTSVPTNVRIRLLNTNLSTTLSLRRADDGVMVSARRDGGPGGDGWMLIPDEPLAPSTRYEVLENGAPLSTFTTGLAPDTQPPQTPLLKQVVFNKSENACVGSSWSLSMEGGDDETTPRDQLLVLVQLQHSNEPADAVTMVSRGNPTFGPCGFAQPEGNWFPVAVQVMDLAGNFSELSEERRAPTCSVAPGGMLGVLALAALRRRRRSNRAGC